MTLYPFILKLLDMTAVGSIAILCVLVTRLLLKKSPKWISYALWAVVLFRLLCPVTLESPVSLIPEAAQSVSETVAFENYEMVTAGAAADAAFRAVGDTLNGGIDTVYVKLDVPEGMSNEELPQQSSSPKLYHDQIYPLFLTCLWPIGMGVLAVYSLVSFVRLKRRLIGAIPLEGNVWLADHIDSPFVLGLVHPKIYLPSFLSEGETEYILLHEQTHLRRFDHVTRALAFMALTIHWFNPLVWVAFLLSGRDMELSCDEAVIKQFGPEIKEDYSLSLLHLATGRRVIAATPLAFGEGDTKGRIKNVLHYKKPAFWVIFIALILTIVLGVTLITDRPNENQKETAFSDMFWSVAESPQDPEASEALFQSIGTVIGQSQTVNGVTATLEGALLDGKYLLLSVSFDLEDVPNSPYYSVDSTDSWLCPSDAVIREAIEKSYSVMEQGFEGITDEELTLWRDHYIDFCYLEMRYQTHTKTAEPRLMIAFQSYRGFGEYVLHLENLDLGFTSIEGPFDFTFTVEEKDASITYPIDRDVEVLEGVIAHVDEITVSPFYAYIKATSDTDPVMGIGAITLSDGSHVIGTGSSGTATEDDGSGLIHLSWTKGPFDRMIDPTQVISIQLGEATIELQGGTP